MKSKQACTRNAGSAPCGRAGAAYASALVGLLTLAGTGQAGAQALDRYVNLNIPGADVDPQVTVTSRQHPDYDPTDIRLGDATIRLFGGESVGYDDNVTGTSKARGSVEIESQAGGQLNYTTDQGHLFAAIDVDDIRYPDQESQSETDWSVYLGGSRNFGEDTLSFSYAHLNLFENARDLDSPQLNQAIQFQVDDAQIGYTVRFNRVSVEPDFEFSSYSYQNGSVAGQRYAQDFRDRDVYSPGATVRYEVAPRETLVAVVRNSSAVYGNGDQVGFRRDFNDISALFGVDFNLSGSVRLRALAGYEERDFQSRAYKSIQSPIAELTAIWTPTGLTTLSGSVVRHVQDSADDAVAGYTETDLSFRVDHEYLRNVILNGHGGVSLADYQEGGGSQTLYNVGAGVTWKLNRLAQLGGTYDHFERTSGNGQLLTDTTGFNVGSSYSENRALLQLKLTL